MMHSCQLQRNSEELRLGMYRHSLTYAIAAPGKVRRHSSLAQVGIEHTRGQPHKANMPGSESSRMERDLPLPVLLPSSILLPPSHYSEESARFNSFFYFPT